MAWSGPEDGEGAFACGYEWREEESGKANAQWMARPTEKDSEFND